MYTVYPFIHSCLIAHNFLYELFGYKVVFLKVTSNLFYSADQQLLLYLHFFIAATLVFMRRSRYFVDY